MFSCLLCLVDLWCLLSISGLYSLLFLSTLLMQISIWVWPTNHDYSCCLQSSKINPSFLLLISYLSSSSFHVFTWNSEIDTMHSYSMSDLGCSLLRKLDFCDWSYISVIYWTYLSYYPDIILRSHILLLFITFHLLFLLWS